MIWVWNELTVEMVRDSPPGEGGKANFEQWDLEYPSEEIEHTDFQR